MQVNLSHEMIKVVRAILRDHTHSQLKGFAAGWEPDTEVNGTDALDLFEELYLESNLERCQKPRIYNDAPCGRYRGCRD